ncbi:MAG: PKD domain-containing protein, partial [Gemmatimonadota bacterium]|nr:PKD domain-containing protein [Gemmatimonadota bacterium]
PWQTFQTTVDKIEAATGYDFLDKLPDDIERLVESGDRAPVAAAGGPYSANEGAAVSFDGSHSTDPDVGDVLTYTWNFGDGTSGSGATPSHVYADNGTYTATLTVSDAVGATSTSSAMVAIANVAPTVTSPAGATILVRETYTASATFTDPGTDSWTASADYGDGSGAQSVALSGQSASLQHRYTSAGTFIVTLSVTDDDGGVGTSTATVVVQSTTQGVATLSAFVQQLLDAGRINRGTAANLQASLRGATRQLALGHPLLARLELAAFTVEVEIGDLLNRIPRSDAKALAAFARRVSRSI